MTAEPTVSGGTFDVGGLVDALPCGIVSFDDSGRIVFTNSTLRAMLGYDAGALEGGHVERILTVAGRIFYQTHLFPLLRLTGSAREVFLLLRTSSGADLGALANASRVRRDGATMIDCVLMEVSERRKYEEELLRARQAADRANAELATHARALEAALERERDQAFEIELQTQHTQDQAAELEAQQEELQAAYDQLLARRDELEAARAAADEANRAKSQFLTTMSHELRTPLNAIGGYTQLMEMGVQGPITEKQRQSLERIMSSQRHLLRLVNAVLDLARIEAGRLEYRLEVVEVDAVIAGVLPMVEPQLAEGRLTLVRAGDPRLGARADREKAQQILINLLTNAVKFTPEGGEIAVRARVDESSRMVLVDVSDTGIGIPPEQLVRVFEPFVQVASRNRAKHEGTGLGLAISRDLARGMGGDLTARSTPGEGSTFTLALPRA
jgi:PAS domain S-box-containing protein